MTERDLESVNRVIVERLLTDTVKRIRDTADRIEKEGARNLALASKEDRLLPDIETYPRVAGQVIHEVQTMLFNLGLDHMLGAASNAELARAEKRLS